MTAFTWQGEFASPLREKRYRISNWSIQAMRMRFVCGFTSLLYLAAAAGDYSLAGAGSDFYLMLNLRLLCFAIGWGNVFISFSRRFMALLPWGVAAFMFSVGCAESVQAVLLHPIEGNGHVLFTLLIFLTFYMFLPLSLLPSLIGAGGASLLYILALAMFTPTASEQLLTIALFFLLINGFGVYFLRASNLSLRREYNALREERLLNRRLRREIAERRKAQAQLQLLATTDDLTGLFNRRRFLTACNQELARFNRYGHPVSLLLLDVDHFKNVNDNHGHDVGDKILQALAARFINNLRGTDMLGRLGGEEFGALLPGTGLNDAKTVAEKLCKAVAGRPLKADGLELPISVSIGVVAARADAPTSEELLHLADQALYLAKERGRNQACSVSDLPATKAGGNPEPVSA